MRTVCFMRIIYAQYMWDLWPVLNPISLRDDAPLWLMNKTINGKTFLVVRSSGAKKTRHCGCVARTVWKARNMTASKVFQWPLQVLQPKFQFAPVWQDSPSLKNRWQEILERPENPHKSQRVLVSSINAQASWLVLIGLSVLFHRQSCRGKMG